MNPQKGWHRVLHDTPWTVLHDPGEARCMTKDGYEEWLDVMSSGHPSAVSNTLLTKARSIDRLTRHSHTR